VDVQFQSTSIFPTASGSASLASSTWNNPIDTMILSVLDDFDLDTLSISITDSSDGHVSQASLDSYKRALFHDENDNEDTDRDNSRFNDDDAMSWNFPVGTAIQYTPSSLSSSSSSSQERQKVDTSRLLRTLSNRGLLCHSVPVDALTQTQSTATTRPSQSTNFHDHPHPHTHHITDTNSTLVVLPNHAYTLCHTSTLYTTITSAHPCTDAIGILSHLQFDRLLSNNHDGSVGNDGFNGDNLDKDVVSKKATWIHLTRTQNTSSDNHAANGANGGAVTIRRGLRYTQTLDPYSTTTNDSIHLQRIIGYGTRHREGASSHLNACPSMESSKLILLNNAHASNTAVTKEVYDLRSESIDMTSPHIIRFPSKDIESNTSTRRQTRRQEDVAFGIERTIMRSRGVTNSGTFRTRVFYNGEDCHLNTDTDTDTDGGVNYEGKGYCQIAAHDGSNNTEGGGIEVTIVDLYPRIVKPTLHSLKVVLEHRGIASSSNGMTPTNNHTTTMTSNNDNYQPSSSPPSTYTHLKLDEHIPNHHLSLSSDGSAVLTLTTTLPRNGHSSLYITMDYQPRFHSFETFPADPNRGIDIPPSYASFLLLPPSPPSPHHDGAPSEARYTQSSHLPPTIRVYSNALLLMPPVPDLSMPFNTIGLTGTFYAFLMGASLNLLLKKATTRMADKYKGVEKKKTPIEKLKMLLRGGGGGGGSRFTRWRRNKNVEEEEKNDNDSDGVSYGDSDGDGDGDDDDDGDGISYADSDVSGWGK